MKYRLTLLITFFLLLSCSIFTRGKNNLNDILKKNKSEYRYHDISGSFDLVSETGFLKKNTEFFTKSYLKDDKSNDDKPVEKRLSISKIDSIEIKKKRFQIMKPKLSMFSIWLDSKKYSNKIEYFEKERIFKVRANTGEKEVKLPGGNQVYCYFGQLVDCLASTGLFLESGVKKGDKISFSLIWESYPYNEYIYDRAVNELVSPATLEVEKLKSESVSNFSIEVWNQTISYEVNADGAMESMNWAVQGISIKQNNSSK
ncbi:MAG: hypothetical protein HOE90_19465 [Bacteriovoracaceae bacterium]|jgi:hypothetical protein|nr:hypothetical protein [Bacteriovoracaceae bacterium]